MAGKRSTSRTPSTDPSRPPVSVPWPGCPLPGFGRSLGAEFFDRDTPGVARDLLGCLLLSRAGGALCGGRIVETEAYLGADDPGSHAATRGITNRNAVMFGPPGRVYVYFTYGAHHMLNLVTGAEGAAGAVLVRAIEPLLGLEVMRGRRAGRSDPELTNGPGKLASALGLDLSDNEGRLGQGSLAVYRGSVQATEHIETTGRIGLSAGHDLQLRFFIQGNPYVSRGRTGQTRRA